MPTQRGYTGQLLDPSGLHYYHARYYDGSIGQFISADTAQGPNRYAYVGGNPETLTDPSGHCYIFADGYCIHGSRGKITSRNASAQKTQGCSGTVEQCKLWGTLKKKAATDKANNELLASILYNGLTAFFDILLLIKDGETSGLKWWSDLVSIAGDLLHAGVYLTAWLSAKGLTSIGGISMNKIHQGLATISSFVNGAAAFLQTLSHNPFAAFVATSAKYAAIGTLEGANPFQAFLAIAGAFLSDNDQQIATVGADVILHGIQAYSDAQETQLQQINNESIDQWCSQSGECN